MLLLITGSCARPGVADAAMDEARKADPNIVVFPAIHTIENTEQAARAEVQIEAYRAAIHVAHKRLQELEEQARIATIKAWLRLLAVFMFLGVVVCGVLWWITKSGWCITLGISSIIGGSLLLAIAQYYIQFVWFGIAIGILGILAGIVMGIRHMLRERKNLKSSIEYSKEVEEAAIRESPDAIDSIDGVKEVFRSMQIDSGGYKAFRKLIKQVKAEADA